MSGQVIAETEGRREPALSLGLVRPAHKRRAAAWTPEIIGVIRGWVAQGWSQKAMADRLDITPTGFKARMKRLQLEYVINPRRVVLERGAEVLRAHYGTARDSREVLAEYVAAIGRASTLKRMGEHANRLGLARPEVARRARNVRANEAKKRAMRLAREQAAARLQELLDGGMSLTAAKLQQGHGDKIIRAMKAEGLLVYRPRRVKRDKPPAAPKVAKPAIMPRLVSARPVVECRVAVVAEAPRVLPVLPDPVGGAVYASFAEIQAWAGFFGLAYDGSNGDQVNRLRAAKGMPRLVQDEARAA